jgi:hypothetical protein
MNTCRAPRRISSRFCQLWPSLSTTIDSTAVAPLVVDWLDGLWLLTGFDAIFCIYDHKVIAKVATRRDFSQLN